MCCVLWLVWWVLRVGGKRRQTHAVDMRTTEPGHQSLSTCCGPIRMGCYDATPPDRGLPRQMPDAQLHVADVWLGFKVFIKSGFVICSWGGPGWLLGGQLGAGNTPQDHSVYPT